MIKIYLLANLYHMFMSGRKFIHYFRHVIALLLILRNVLHKKVLYIGEVFYMRKCSKCGSVLHWEVFYMGKCFTWGSVLHKEVFYMLSVLHGDVFYMGKCFT